MAAKVHARVEAGDTALLAHYGDRAAGMLVAEPFRDDGVLDPACGHLSMLFVDPALWGCGVGGALVRVAPARRPRARAGPGCRCGRARRTAARRRLYAARGFVDTGERTSLHEGEIICRLEWRAGS